MRFSIFLSTLLIPLALSSQALAASPAPSPTPSAAASSPQPSPSPELPGISGMRVEAGDQTVHLEIELPMAVQFQERANPDAWELRLPGVSPGVGAAPINDPVLSSLTVAGDQTGSTVKVDWKYWCPTEFQLDDDGRRIGVTFRKVYKEEQDETLAPGVVHEHLREADANGPLDIHVLKVDPRQPGVKLAPGMAGGGNYFARETVSGITTRYGAIAGINGSYFSPKTGEPLGLLMIDGQLVSSPLYNRTALAIGANGEIYIGNTQLSSRLVLPTGESYDFDGVNQARGMNRMVLYTGNYGPSTFSPPGGKEYTLLPDGTVLSVQDANSTIPPGGYVISAQGQPADWLDRYVKVGSKVQLTSPLTQYWPGVRSAIGGGPTLLRGGQVTITALEEQFKSDITQGIAPRTAVGLTPDGKVMLVTVDGRLPSVSRGLSLTGLAYLLQELGATDALNLDGGGSTAMAIGPTVVNHPSDGSERRVNNALLVFANQTQAATK